VWWEKSVIHQVYSRSFNDSNGDGNGCIPGLREKVYKLIPFWPGKGIDGFRMDVTGMN
jgi:alpha-glucosidase